MIVACSPQVPAQNVPAEESAQTGLDKGDFVIRSANGEHRFTVEIAATAEEQERGLMFRRSLGPDEGMIFPYAPPREVAFWMRNTLIPLDIIYIGPDSRITRIVEAKPLDETPLPSGEPVSLVLEIAGGRAAELGIREGDLAAPPVPCCKP